MPIKAERIHDDLAAKVAAMDALVQILVRDNEQMRAKLATLEQRDAQPAPTPEWGALKAVARGQYSYEAVRKWCEDGVIEAKKERGRWYVKTASLSAHLARLKTA
jgi:hypothetical protein